MFELNPEKQHPFVALCDRRADRMGGDSRRNMVFRPRTLRHVRACVRRVFARHVRDVYRDASLSLERVLEKQGSCVWLQGGAGK